MTKTIFVLGAGNGLGNRVAERFGREGFRVVLMARSQEHLDAYEREFGEKGIDVLTRTLDASKPYEISRVLDELVAQVGTPDVLFYNVGVTMADADVPGEVDADLLMERYQVDVAGAYQAVQCVVTDEFAEKRGAILLTSGGFALYPTADYLPLSMDKAALRAMGQALNAQLAGRGVYVGVVTPLGVVAPGTDHDPALLAEDYWRLYTERSTWEIQR